MKKYTLSASSRTVFGRKVKKLRQVGKIPATVYGKKFKSTSISVGEKDFAKVHREAGETGLIELALEKDTLPVLIHDVQTDPVTSALLHVEFFKVDLKQKVHASVPVVIVGESPAVAQKIGVLLTVLSEVEVEALPADLPENIKADVSVLSGVNSELKVADLHIGSNITVLAEPTQTVVKVGALVSKEAEVQAAAETAAAAAAAPAPEAETAEAEAAAKEEAPKPEEKKEATTS